MSTIGGISGASSAWSGKHAERSAQMKDKMFAKVDADGSGGVDKTELQGMLDHIAEKSGTSLGTADDLFTKLDTNGDGSIGKDELADGMKSLMPPPSSTVGFAQQRGGDGDGDDGMSCKPPPPGGAPAAAASSTGSTGSKSSSSDTDPLDTNQDGVVSAQERAAGDVKAMLDDFLKKLKGDGSDSSAQQADTASFATALAERLLKEYGASSESKTTQGAGSSIDVSA